MGRNSIRNVKMTRTNTIAGIKAYLVKNTRLVAMKKEFGIGNPKVTQIDLVMATTYLKVLSHNDSFCLLENKEQVLKNAHKYT